MKTVRFDSEDRRSSHLGQGSIGIAPARDKIRVMVFEKFRNPKPLSSRYYCGKPLRFVRFNRVRAKIGYIFSDHKTFVNGLFKENVLSRYCRDGRLTFDKIRCKRLCASRVRLKISRIFQKQIGHR